MHPRLKKFVDFLLGEPDQAPPVNPKVKSAPPAEKVPAVNNHEGDFFKEFLLQIYPCSKPFDKDKR